jgi:hypothetical protein
VGGGAINKVEGGDLARGTGEVLEAAVGGTEDVYKLRSHFTWSQSNSLINTAQDLCDLDVPRPGGVSRAREGKVDRGGVAGVLSDVNIHWGESAISTLMEKVK